MKVSARNVFEGRIQALVPGPVNTEVTLELPGGDALVAVITQASARDLGLAVGGQAMAIVKAPWVIVAAGDGGPRFSSRNQLRGVVSAVRSGPINADVAIQLPGGATVHAVITQEAAAELGLAPGVPARAVIKASHVVLAVQG
ncbi:molybdopterin-binding protein [Ideonella sp. A 288]|uniref:TOBE domain-containing protein n=1 Tax=Ideonella sp. A 288 TaxID=1962181 RepID=UPI000B4B9F83|nr:TOBE domain-containing protein [Ideonella sp. A 288]